MTLKIRQKLRPQATILILVAVLLLAAFLAKANLELIKSRLELSDFSEFSQFSDSQIKKVLEKEIDPKNAAGLTYGIYISSILNEMDFIEWISTGQYKNEFYEEFNQIVDEKTNLRKLHIQTGQQIIFKIIGGIQGGTLEMASGVPLNSIGLTSKVINIGKVAFKVAQMKMYDGIWRYFDERKHNASHQEAWEWARVQMGWDPDPEDIKEFSSWDPVALVNQRTTQLEPEFQSLWDQWGKYLSKGSINQATKDQVKKELRQALLTALKEQAQEPQKISWWQKIKNGLKNLVQNTTSIIPKAAETLKRIRSFISQLNPFSPAGITEQIKTDGTDGAAPSAPSGADGAAPSVPSVLKPKSEPAPVSELPEPVPEPEIEPGTPEPEPESEIGQEIESESEPEIESEPEPISQLPITPPITPSVGQSFISGGGPAPSAAPDDTTPPSIPLITSHSSGDILGPSDDSATTTTGFQINLAGTAEANATILISVNPTYTTSTDANGNWQKEITLSESANQIKVKAKDAANNESPETSLTLTVDTTPPSAITNLSASPGPSRGQIALNWTAPGNNESSGKATQYILRYATSSAITTSTWAIAADIENEPTPALASTTESFFISSLTPGQTYYFVIKSQDQVANLSEISNSPSSQASALATHVVINEIQVADNEFVELYNPSSQAIDMTGWYWSYFPYNYDWNNPTRNQKFPDSATIPAKGYYLIGLSGFPKSGSYLDVDWQVYVSQQLNNQKGSVAIFPWDSTTTSTEAAKNGRIDAVSWGAVSYVYESAAASAPVTNGSLERQTTGWDMDNNSADFIQNILSTPTNSQNKTITLIADSVKITQNTTWTLARSPYILESNSAVYPTIESGATLTIESGTTIKGANKYYPSLIIKGGLKAQGTASSPIKFTAATTTLSAGAWSGIIFDNSTSTDSVLEYVNFEYGGYQVNYSGSQIKEMLRINNSQATIKNSTFKNSQNIGAYLNDSDSSVSDSVFENNVIGLVVSGSNSQPTISNSQFKNNTSIGLEIINEASPTVSNNSFSGNYYAMKMKSAYPVLSNSQAQNNTLNGLLVDQESIFSQNITWQPDLPYILASGSNQSPKVATGTVLTIKPAVVIKPQNPFYTTLTIEGKLIAQGAFSTPIIFTSLKDDTFGGDTNNDSSATAPAVSDWKNIKFAAGSQGDLDWITFRYGYNTNQVLDINSQAAVNLGSNIIYEP